MNINVLCMCLWEWHFLTDCVYFAYHNYHIRNSDGEDRGRKDHDYFFGSHRIFACLQSSNPEWEWIRRNLVCLGNTLAPHLLKNRMRWIIERFDSFFFWLRESVILLRHSLKVKKVIPYGSWFGKRFQGFVWLGTEWPEEQVDSWLHQVSEVVEQPPSSRFRRLRGEEFLNEKEAGHIIHIPNACKRK